MVVALVRQLIQHGFKTGAAVAHGVTHGAVETAGQRFGLLLGHQPDRRVLLPDGGVEFRHPARPQRQDDQPQHPEPDQARRFHHPGVGQELLQITAHRRRGGRVWGAQIDQDHRRFRHGHNKPSPE